MCGICGFYGFEDNDLIKKMNLVQNHRGPDSKGIYSDKLCTLGHTRLSIIDLSNAGNQPMSNEDSSIWLSFNGEIYNFQEIKKKLTKHNFKSSTDTEVIIHAYEEYGIDCVNLFNGMFAFALWDTNKKTLFLARDRLGIKPLHYLITENKVVFASEQKAILEYKNYQPEINLESMNNFLEFRYNNSDDTLFKGIKKLPPGNIMKIHDKKSTLSRYWKTEFGNHKGNIKQLSEKLNNLLLDSIEKRQISDVPLGVYLSGGVDSSSVVSLMSQHTSNIKTFSIGFNGNDELDKARKIADYYNTDHHEIQVSSTSIKHYPKVIWHLDEPMSDLATIPVYVMSKTAKKKATVILTGDGNDEVWGGYHYYKEYRRISKISQAAKIIPEKTRSWLIKKTQLFNNKKLTHIDKYIDIKHISNYSHFKYKETIYTNNTLNKINEVNSKKAILEKYLFPIKDPVNASINLDLNNLLPNSYLVKNDRMTMASSIEARVPLLDHRIVEFACSLKGNLKYRKNQEKFLFNKTMKKNLPYHLMKYKKRGFGVPKQVWLKELSSVAESELTSLKKRDFFKTQFLEKMKSKLRSPNQMNSQQIFSLIALEIWNKIYIDKINPDKISNEW